MKTDPNAFFTRTRASRAVADEFSRLLTEHRGIVLKVAHGYAASVQAREDLAQEIVAQAWRAFAEFDRQRLFSTWLYRVALNVAISQLRREQLVRTHVEALSEHHQTVIGAADVDDPQAQRIDQLHACLARLAPLDRALVMLYLDEYSYREIAEVIGLSETNVATKLSRLKQRIRAELSH